jgi:hypothetical protein
MYRPEYFQTIKKLVDSSALRDVPRNEMGLWISPNCWRIGLIGPIEGE